MCYASLGKFQFQVTRLPDAIGLRCPNAFLRLKNLTKFKQMGYPYV